MASKMFNPMHPGQFIFEGYMRELGISLRTLARSLDIAPSSLSRILNGATRVTPDMALRFSVVLGRSPESWLKLQENYDLWHAKQTFDASRLTPIAQIS